LVSESTRAANGSFHPSWVKLVERGQRVGLEHVALWHRHHEQHVVGLGEHLLEALEARETRVLFREEDAVVGREAGAQPAGADDCEQRQAERDRGLGA